MPTDRYVALLRGLNLGGRRIPKDELAGLFEEAGCVDVTTYIASGNVIFGASAALAKKLPAQVAKVIEARYGFESPVVLRSSKQLAAAVAANPFPKAPEDALYVGYLAAQPAPAAVAKLDPQRSPGDLFAIVGAEIYMHLQKGAAETKLTNAWFDKQLGTVSTFRNWRTARKLVELAAG